MNIKKNYGYRLFTIIACVIFLVLAGIYFYLLQCNYPPEPESVMTISSIYSHLTLGTPYKIREYLYSLCSLLAVKIGGMTYFSAKFCYTILYIALLSCTMYLSLRSKTDRRIKLYLLPMIGLFSVCLFPVADNVDYFQFPQGVDLMYGWPFIYHYPARIYSVLCPLILMRMINCKERKRKTAYSVLFGLTCLYAMKTTDLIFYIMFMAPLFIVTFLWALHRAEYRKYAVYALNCGMGILFLSRVMPYAAKGNLWAKSRADVYGNIYGGTNWISIDSLGTNVINFLKLNILNFNIQLFEAPVISLHTFVLVFKTLILIAGYIMMFHIVKCSLTGKGEKYHYDGIDEILAWAYILLMILYLFTDFGSFVVYFKYFCGMNTLMTIILCRNIESFPKIVKIKALEGIKHKKVLVCVYALILWACNMSKVWTYSASDSYGPEFEAIEKYIECTQYGYVVAPSWLTPQIDALSKGKIMVWPSVRDVKNIYGDEAKVAYIITNNVDNEEIGANIYDHCENYEEICEYYSEPTNIINYNKLQLIVFENGVKVKE